MSDIRNLEIDLDIKQNLLVTINCKQLDNLNLKFNIWDNGQVADLSNYKCRLKALKSDQIPLIQNTDISISGNVVTLETDEQLTTTSGNVKTELQFIDKATGKKKSTFDLNIKVISSALEVNRTISKATVTLLEDLDNKLDQIEDIGTVLDEAIIVKSELKADIVNGNTTKSNLETATTNANTKKQEVNTAITNATNKIIEVNTSITNANASKTALDSSKEIADTSKTNLDSANTLAEHNIEELNKLGDVTDLAEKVQTNTNNISDLKLDKTNILNTIGNVELQTTDKTIKGAINENATQLNDLANNKANKYDGSTSDFNQTLTQGKYTFSNTAINGFKTWYGELEVIVSGGGTHNNDNWIWQIAYYTDGTIANRCKTNAEDWTEWKQISTSKSITEYAITPLLGFQTVSGSKASYYKTIEGEVTINIHLERSTGLSGSGDIICKVPDGYKPNEFIRSIGLVNNNIATCFAINQKGEIVFNSDFTNVTLVDLSFNFKAVE